MLGRFGKYCLAFVYRLIANYKGYRIPLFSEYYYEEEDKNQKWEHLKIIEVLYLLL